MSKMIMSFEAECFEELAAKIIKAAQTMGYDPNQFELPFAEAPKKQPKPAPLPPEPSEIPEELPAAATLTASREAVVEALKKVMATKGHETVTKILTKFKCARVSDIKETDYDKVLQACEKVA